MQPTHAYNTLEYLAYETGSINLKPTNMGKVKYSFIIDSPSPDIDATGMEQIHASIAVADLNHLINVGAINGNVIIPTHIVNFMKSCVERGSHRVEIVDGGVSYKLYVKPDDNG